MNEIVFDIDEENKNNASQKEITFDIEKQKSAIPQQEIIYDIEAQDSTSSQQDIIYDIDQEQGQVQKLSSEVPEISPRTFPLKEAVQADEEGFFANLMSGLEVIDRPRAANVKAVEKFIDQSFDGNLNSGDIGEEWMKGIQGADHAMFGEYLNNKVNKVRANPKDYPIAAPIIETLDKVLAIPDMAMDWYQTKTETDMLKFGTIMGLAICNGDKECEKRFIANKAIPAANTIKKRIEEREQEEISNNFAWVTGFLGDVALDPLSYFNKIVTVVKTTGNAIKFIIPDKVINEISKKSGLAKEEVRKKTDALLKTRTGETLTDFTNRVWAVFSTKHELKMMGPEGSTAYDLMSKFKSLVAAARVKAVRDNKQFQERVKQYSVDTGVPVEDINRFITEAVERGGIGNINPNNISKESIELLSKNDEVRYEVWALSNKNKEQLKIELDAGIPIVKMKEQVLVHGGDETLLMDYLLRAVTPEAREAMLKQVGRKKYANSSAEIKHTSAYQRRDDWEGLTIVDINNLAKKGELPGYEGQVFKKGFFHEDPAVIQALRDDKHYRSLAAMDLAEGLTAQFGFSGDDLIKLATDGGWQPSATVKKLTPKHALEYLKKTNPTEFGDLVITTNKFTDGHAMPSEIAKFVEDNLTFINNPNKVDEFLKGWDATTKWFKSWTLSLFPGYHERNIAGNMWNNFVSGVKLKSYKDALKVQRGIAIGEQGSIKLGNKTYTYNELRDLADNNGVTSRGLYAVDIEKSLIEEMGGAEKWMTLSSENKAIAYGKKVGEVIEDNARFANFLDGLTKGMTPEKAAKRVRHTLFDYGDLTKTEQQIFKRLFPFYTWTRKNIPFQIENIIKHPGKYKAIDTLRQEVEAAAGPEDKNEKYLADWMLANYPMKIRVNEDNQTEYFLLGGWFPGADVWKLASKPETVPKDLLHPLLKIGLEMYSASTNEQGLVTDLFSGKKLDPKQKTDYFFGTVPEDIKHYLNNLRVLNVLDGFVTGYRSDIGEYPKKLSPFTKEPKSLEEAWLTFLTGINKMKVDLEANKLFWQQSKQKQFQGTQTRFQQVIKKDRPVEERAAPIEEGKKILKQLDKGSKFAEGGEVTEPTLAEDIQSSLGKRFENIKKSSQYRKEGKQGPLYTSLQGVGQLAGGVYDIGAELVSHGASEVGDVLEENFPEAYQATAEKLTEAKNWVMNTDAGKYALDMAAKGYENYQEFKKNNPQDALALESALNLGALTWGGKTVATVTEPKYRLAKQMQKDIDKSTAGYSSAQVASTFKPSTEDSNPNDYWTERKAEVTAEKKNRVRKKILKLEKQEKQAKRAEEKKLTQKEIKEIGTQLSESDGFKYKLPAIITEAATKDKIGDAKPDQWKYTISRWIKKNKVKQEEVDDTFLMDWLNEQDPNTKLSSKDIFNYVKDNSPQLKVYSNPLNEKKVSGQDWLNKQPLIVESRELAGKVHDAYQNILIRNNNFESQEFLDLLGEQKSKAVKKALKNTKNLFDDGYLTHGFYLGNARTSDPAFEGLMNSPVFVQYTKDYVRDVEFGLSRRGDFDDVPPTPKMVNDWISDYGLEYAMGKAFRQLQKSPRQERIKLFKEVVYHDIVKMLNDSSTTNAQKEAIKEVKDKIDNVFKTKFKFENFKDTHEKELNDLFKESERLEASTVDDSMWSQYALNNMAGKPVTILVQAKVGAEDRLKRVEELSKTIKYYESDIRALNRNSQEVEDINIDNALIKKSKEEFEEVTGIPWDKRKETLEMLDKETSDIYKEPHWTGSFNDKSALKAGLPEENIFMHVRGRTMLGKSLEGNSIPDDSKGLFILEQQAQPHQTAMANKAALENIQEFNPTFRRTLPNTTGYAKKGSGPEVQRLMKERDAIEIEVDNISRKIESENRTGTEKEKQKISELNDKASELHTKIVNLRGALSDADSQSIPEVLSHKRDWTPLAMKQSLKYALDNDLDYLVLPIERHSIKSIEQWGDDKRDIINTIIDRNSIYSPRAYRDIVRKWDKDAKPIEDYYYNNNGITSDDVHKVIILPITDKIKAGYKKDGLTAYRRGGLVTQMKALSLSA